MKVCLFIENDITVYHFMVKNTFTRRQDQKLCREPTYHLTHLIGIEMAAEQPNPVAAGYV